MKKVKRIVQFITGFHRIHHINYSFGYKLPFLKIGYFNDKKHYKQFGFKRIKGHAIDYHNCTTTGIF